MNRARPARCLLAMALLVAGGACSNGGGNRPAARGSLPRVTTVAGAADANAATAATAATAPPTSPPATPATTLAGKPAPGAGGATATPVSTANPPPSPGYAPTPSSGGTAPAVLVSFSDLIVKAGQVITFTVDQNSPGDLYLDAYSPSASAPFPIGSLRACAGMSGGAPCTPAAVPNPAYWAVGADVLARTHSFQIRVLATQSSGALLGLHAGWEGTTQVTADGLYLAGGCSTATHYQTGCGARVHFTTPAGPVSFSTASPGLQLEAKDKSTGATIFYGALNATATFNMPGAGECSSHVWPANGSPVANLTLTVRWP